jgi:Ca2+-binding RTX toxin-like protein
MICVAGAGEAGAATKVQDFYSDRYGGDYFSIEGTNGRNTVTVEEPKPDHFVISDPAGVENEAGCRKLSGISVACTLYRDDLLGFDIYLDGGDDRLELNGNPNGRSIYAFDMFVNGGRGADLLLFGASAPRASIGGGRGNDRVSGAPGPDRLHGGPGDDILLGNGGRDQLSGDDGRDILRGGSGPDVLFAPGRRWAKHPDPDPDRSVSCGRGTDHALVDREDPAPRGCESVRSAAQAERR